MVALTALPNELLSLVANHLDRPKDVLNLSLTSRKLDHFVRLDGWKAFLKGRFGLSGLDADARNAVHGLTTLYRNWNRKAFIARYAHPTQELISLNSWAQTTWTGPQGQTMGYRPSIDSYEVQSSWTNRKELVAWSAGTSVLVKVKETGPKELELQEEGNGVGNSKETSEWYTYKLPNGREGRDDLSALKLLRPHQLDEDFEGLVFGTASGDLKMLQFSTKAKVQVVQSYNTFLESQPLGSRPIGAVAVSSSQDPLLAASLGDSSLALYPIHIRDTSEVPLDPLSSVVPEVFGNEGGRIWSTSFISDDLISIGMGPSCEPIQVFSVTPDGLSPKPIRKFNLDVRSWARGGTITNASNKTSVYPILPVYTSSQAGSRSGHTFLSGGYDGIIRLHDMRSPNDFETMYYDVTNDSSIYSLATQGVERVIAGTSMHSMLKVFDLRFSGSHAYETIPVAASTKAKPKAHNGDYAVNRIVSEAFIHTGKRPISGGWNLFLNPRNDNRNNDHRHRRVNQVPDSPIYSLSIPSPTSPNLYAGVEGAVLTLTFQSIMDPHPDPLFADRISRFPDSGKIDVKKSYNPSGDALNLGMYEQGDENALVMRLMVQDGVYMGVSKNARNRDGEKFRGLDERWKDPGDDRTRWNRGEDPGSRRGHRTRGRSRGRGHRGS